MIVFTKVAQAWILILYSLEDHHFKYLASLSRNILIRQHLVHNHNALRKRSLRGRDGDG